jgi:CO dehydrogenase/acetyl-CoA synthase gamma subunit (corrinoid Fe-S protein)
LTNRSASAQTPGGVVPRASCSQCEMSSCLELAHTLARGAARIRSCSIRLPLPKLRAEIPKHSRPDFFDWDVCHETPSKRT